MAEVQRDTPEDAAYDVRLFSQFLAVLGDRQADPDLMAQLLRVIESTKALAERTECDSKGSLSIKIKVKTDKDLMTSFGYDYTTVEPKAPKRGTVMWMRKDGRLSLRDPKQMEMWKTVDGGKSVAARDVTQAQTPGREVQ